MPPKKVANPATVKAATQEAVKEAVDKAKKEAPKTTVVAAPVVVAKPTPAPTVVVKQAPAPASTVVVKTEKPKEMTKEEIKKEAMKQIEEEEAAKKPSKFRKVVQCLVKTFIVIVGLLMIIIGAMGYVTLFTGYFWKYAVDNPNVLISNLLTNFWYIVFGFILFSGVCKIPHFTFYFGFTRNLVGFSFFIIL